MSFINRNNHAYILKET